MKILRKISEFRVSSAMLAPVHWGRFQFQCFQFETTYVRFRLLYTVHVKDTRKLKNCPSLSKSKNGQAFHQTALWLKFVLREFSKIISIEAERRKHSTDLSCCRLDGVKKCSGLAMHGIYGFLERKKIIQKRNCTIFYDQIGRYFFDCLCLCF